tara:strand:+ start:399 stop:1730 length:1332 start_codon:yes stop_codon:yes gene_type:complete
MVQNFLKINKKIGSFKKKILVDGDKSLSIRWALLSSQGVGQSIAKNILKSEDLINTLNCLKKLGVKIKLKKNICIIEGVGINGFAYKKKIVLNAGNSGTLGRLILPLLIKSPYKIKIIGDKSLSRRDFSRVIEPLKKIGANFYPNKKKTLPIYIKGSDFLRPIYYEEEKGSAQCKSCVMLASINTPGQISIKAKKSRDHTERMFKELKIPIEIKKNRNLDFIKVSKPKLIRNFNFNIPGDISSSAFFIVLTLLSKGSSLVLKNININPSRMGVIRILNKMGAKIKIKNKKKQFGEECADIIVKSSKNLKGINCPSNLNSSAIDEFLIIFLAASKAKGISYFKNLSELNEKESPRLKIASKILKMMGVKIISNNSSIKIYGNPDIVLNKDYIIKNYLKDHRVFMMCAIAALSFGGNWKIFNPDSINTSFPSFLNIIKQLGGKTN